MSKTSRLSLPLIMAAQAQKHITHNEALAALDILVQLTLESRTQTTPPANPIDGQSFLIPEDAEGLWRGKGGWIAACLGGGWRFFEPRDGWRGFVRDEDRTIVRSKAAWRGYTFDAPDAICLVRAQKVAVSDLPAPSMSDLGRFVFFQRDDEKPMLLVCDGTDWLIVDTRILEPDMRLGTGLEDENQSPTS